MQEEDPYLFRRRERRALLAARDEMLEATLGRRAGAAGRGGADDVMRFDDGMLEDEMEMMEMRFARRMMRGEVER